MKNYLLLVSHGTMAPGVHSVMRMLFGERDDLMSVSLEDGMAVDVYAERVRAKVAHVKAGDRLWVFADLIGGSPLTTALNVINERGLLGTTRAFGGLNLAMVMAAMSEGIDGGLDADSMGEVIVEWGRQAVSEFSLEDMLAEDEGEDEDDEEL